MSSAVCCQKEVRARKPHRCEDCELAISPGMPYIRYSGIFEGCPYRYRVCKWCALARAGLTQWLCEHPHPFLDPYEDAPAMGDLWGFLRQEWPELFRNKEQGQ